MTQRIELEEYAMLLAWAASTRSEDPYTKVGSCILREDGSVASLGYNGAPPSIQINWDDRDARRKRVVHAEANALRFVRPGEGWMIASTYLPCGECIKLIRGYGILYVCYDNLLPAPTYNSKEIISIGEEFHIEFEQVSYLPVLDSLVPGPRII